ncbi:MAG: hypothetical protein P8X74_23960 [Reinekea sp.]
MKQTIVFTVLFFVLGFVRAYASTCPALVYKGSIDNKYRITLRVDNSIALLDHELAWGDGSFTGSYVYDKYNKPLEFNATRNSENQLNKHPF